MKGEKYMKELEMNIYEKLLNARIEFQELKINKTGKNDFAGFTYYELSDIIPAINSLCRKYSILPITKFDSDLAYMTLVNLEDTSEQIIFTSPMADANLRGCHSIQNVGAVETYQRRYLYMVAFEIVDKDALDPSSNRGGGTSYTDKGENGFKGQSRANTGDNKQSTGGYKLSEAQLKRLYTVARKNSISNEQVVKWVLQKYSCKPDDMNREQYDACVAALEAKKEGV